MSAFPTPQHPMAAARSAKVEPPAWASRFAGRRDAALVRRCIRNVVDRSATDLLNAVRDAYASVFASAVGRVVRCWNFIPGITDLVAGDQTRYMIFNAGRYAAFLDQFGPAEMFDAYVPTASAVGCDGDDLWIHALSVEAPSTQLGNPRQTSPHRYSERFGKRPPCFARATRVGNLLLVGGTASICGEESLHTDLAGQTAETLINLRAVLSNGGVAGGFDAVTDVRVYHPRAADAPALHESLSKPFAAAGTIEFIQAELCRPELRVEIEVVADLGRSNGGAA
jgi:chorismate lyase/3-hydroxybenzoate synthase